MGLVEDGRPAIDFIGPLRPCKSGIADYLEDLLPALSRYCSPRVFVDNHREARVSEFWSTRVLDQAGELPNFPIVHVGNNQYHKFCFKWARENKSIVVLHDINLHHLVTDLTLPQGDWAGYSDLLAEEYGDLGRRVASQRSEWAFSEFQMFLMPVTWPALVRAAGVIVHSYWAEQKIQQAYPALPVVRIPHFYIDNHSDRDAVSAKVSFGLDPEACVVGALGFVTPPKQVSLLLRAASEVQQRLKDRNWQILIAGEASDPGQLERDIAELGLERRVVRTGYLPTERFDDALAACDIVSNLRYPTAGETSGVLVRAMGAGKTCMIFRYGAFLDFPSNTVCSVPIETQDPTALANQLTHAIVNPSYRRQVGEEARSFILRAHDPEDCARAYVDFYRTVSGLASNQSSGGNYERAAIAQRG